MKRRGDGEMERRGEKAIGRCDQLKVNSEM